MVVFRHGGAVKRLRLFWDRWHFSTTGGYVVQFDLVDASQVAEMTRWCEEVLPAQWTSIQVWRALTGGYRFRHRADAEMFRLAFSHFNPTRVTFYRGGIMNWWSATMFSSETPEWQAMLMAVPIVIALLPLMLFLHCIEVLERWEAKRRWR